MWLTIGDLSKRSGVAPSALRYYEARGLIRTERNRSGHRRYSRDVLRRVAFIVFARRIGLTLDAVALELAQLPSNRVPEGADWAKLSGNWTRRIDERIADLERLRDGLIQCVGCGCLSLEACQFANPGDRAARYGPGAVYLAAPSRHSCQKRGTSRTRLSSAHAESTSCPE